MVSMDKSIENRKALLVIQSSIKVIRVDSSDLLLKKHMNNFKRQNNHKITISSPGLQESQRSPSRMQSFERGKRPGATLLGDSWIVIL